MHQPDFNPELVFQEAMQAHQSGLFNRAEELLRNILEHMPEQDGIMGTLGGVMLAGGKIQESMEVLERALALNADNIDAQLNLGIAYQSLGQMDQAFSMIESASKRAPDRADIQYNLANILIQSQQYNEGIEVLKRVIEINPAFIAAYHNLGALYSFQQKTEEAIKVYEQALGVVPDDLNTLILLGNILSDVGLMDKALQVYLKAATIHADYFLPHAVLGKFYLDIGEEEKGEASLKKAYELNPNDLNTNILLGNVSKSLGREEDAENFYRQALRIDPQNQGALSNLRRILSAKIPYWHFEMLADTERNDAYQKVIEKHITKNSAVLDIGTGSGLLAMMAARAGAANVVACEMHPRLASTAKRIVKANGFEEVIKVYEKKSTKLKIGEEVPAKVDVIISEILDVGAIGEGALPSIRHAVQNLAKSNAILIPCKVHLYGQIIEIPSRSLVAPIRKISGFDLSLFEEYRIPNEYLKINLKAEKYKTLSLVFPLMEIDFYNVPPAYPDDQPRPFPLNIEMTDSGVAQALVFWFDLYLNKETKVSSRVDGKLEHWGQALFCFPNPRMVQKGNKLSVTMLQSDQLIRFLLPE